MAKVTQRNGDIIRTVLTVDLEKDDTFTVGYPSGRSQTSYVATDNHRLAALQTIYTVDKGEIEVTLGASDITVKYKGETTIPAETPIALELDLGDTVVAEGPQQPAIEDPSGTSGDTDPEARAAIEQIIDALEAFGIVKPAS